MPSKHLSRCRRFSLDELQLATNNFDDSMVIGKGGFGKVYKGNIIYNNANGSSSSSSSSSTTTVAIKRLNPSSKQGAPQFWTEINMLSKFRHSHLVSLIGYCDNCNEMILVYEYMVRGSLADHVQRKNHNGKTLPLSWVQRLKICIGTARGLDYLHTGTAILKRVIHLDVKSSNILLDENWAAKISDFGLSRIGPAEQECTHVSTTHIRGTMGYIDPDYLLTHRFTRKSDVYAFGVVLLEILCERPALDRSLDQDQWGLAGWGQRCIKEGASHKIIGPNLKWEIFPNSLREFVQIADQCLHNCPTQRPTMSEVVVKLELALASQLHRDLLTMDYAFDTFLPVNNQEIAVSYQEDDHIDKVLQLGDSSSKQISPAGENAESMKIVQRKQKKGHCKVELLSPIPKPSTEEPKAEEKETQKKEEPQVVTVVLKVYMHCEGCAQELKKCIQKVKDPDLKGSQVTVKGVFDPEQLVKYVYKQTRKRAVIVKPDPENKKEEDKGKEEKKTEEPATAENKKATGKHTAIVKPESKEEKKPEEPTTAEKKKRTGEQAPIVKPDPKNKKEEDKGKEEKKAKEPAKEEDKGKEEKKTEELTYTENKKATGKHAAIVKPDPKEQKKAEVLATTEKKKRTGKHGAIVKPDPENKKEEDKGKEEKKAKEPATIEKKTRTGKHTAIVKPDPDNKKEDDKGKEEKKAEDQAEKKTRTGKHAAIVKPDPENKNEENKGKEEKKAEEPAVAEKNRRTGKHTAIVKPDPENKKEEDKGKEEKKAEEHAPTEKQGAKAKEKKEGGGEDYQIGHQRFASEMRLVYHPPPLQMPQQLMMFSDENPNACSVM
ncbi:hypothetical protein LguiB_026158 [Lonicera macranthoides]